MLLLVELRVPTTHPTNYYSKEKKKGKQRNKAKLRRSALVLSQKLVEGRDI